MTSKEERELPKVNSEFTRVYKGKAYTLKVVKLKAGIAYELNGQIFKSPTSAAKSLTKSEVNGWIFWKIAKRKKFGQSFFSNS